MPPAPPVIKATFPPNLPSVIFHTLHLPIPVDDLWPDGRSQYPPREVLRRPRASRPPSSGFALRRSRVLDLSRAEKVVVRNTTVRSRYRSDCRSDRVVLWSRLRHALP